MLCWQLLPKWPLAGTATQETLGHKIRDELYTALGHFIGPTLVRAE